MVCHTHMSSPYLIPNSDDEEDLSLVRSYLQHSQRASTSVLLLDLVVHLLVTIFIINFLLLFLLIIIQVRGLGAGAQGEQ